jgi:MAPEG family
MALNRSAARTDPERLNRSLLPLGLAGALLTGVSAFAAFALLPVPSGTTIAVALGWLGIAGLFGPAMAINAVAHERLQGDSFDPLAGRTTRRLQVNQRFLQNTIEQFVLFAVGLVLLAVQDVGSSTTGKRWLAALTVGWLISRFLFWMGYHRSSGQRVLGVVSLFIPFGMLIVAAVHFGGSTWGIAGVLAPLTLLAVIEALLFRLTREA